VGPFSYVLPPLAQTSSYTTAGCSAASCGIDRAHAESKRQLYRQRSSTKRSEQFKQGKEQANLCQDVSLWLIGVDDFVCGLVGVDDALCVTFVIVLSS